MLTASNRAQNATDFTRQGLLRSWVEQEATLGHWGTGRPETSYRISEGGGEEFGSIGLSQIKYSYRYGVAGYCSDLSAYNLYDPEDSVKSVIVFGSTRCGGGFLNAFTTIGRHQYGADQLNNPDLLGYRHGNNTIHTINQGRTDDAYELMMRAVATYNGGSGIRNPWGVMLTAALPQTVTSASRNRTYAIEIRRRYGLPERTYIWRGASDTDINGDNIIANIPDDPVTPINETLIEEEWCFRYSEDDWYLGRSFRSVREQTERVINGRGLTGDVSNEESCP